MQFKSPLFPFFAMLIMGLPMLVGDDLPSCELDPPKGIFAPPKPCSKKVQVPANKEILPPPKPVQVPNNLWFARTYRPRSITCSMPFCKYHSSLGLA